MGNEQARSARGEADLHGISAMDQKMQEKFAKGIQFNMKVIIRGERNTGKTSLFHRLQGGRFTDAYQPTDQIQAGTIVWGYKGTSDKVKVEIWDVVDKGRPKKQSSNTLKLFHREQSTPEVSNTLDAEFLDVFQGTHGVIFVFDICKKWTWTYIEDQLPKVPYHIPVIVLGNFRDMGEHRTVSTDEPLAFMRHMERPSGAAEVRYCETSMKDCFGLSYLHKFFSVPFLQMQQEMLLQQLQENRLQLQLTMEELEYRAESTDFNYTRFQQMVREKEEERKSAQKEEERKRAQKEEEKRSVQMAVGKLKKQASVDKGTPALGRGELPRGQTGLTESPDVLGQGYSDEEDGEEEEETNDSSDDDEAKGNPLVAGDEDIESEEEVSAVVSAPSSDLTHIQSEGKCLQNRSAKRKTVKDVQLTESESDTDQPAPDSVEESHQPAKIKMSGEFAFDEPLIPTAVAPLSVVAPEPERVKGSTVGGGLLLSFGSSEQQTVEKKEEAGKGKERGKRKKKGRKVAHSEEGQPPASATLDLDSWLGDAGQGEAESKEPVAGTRKKGSKRKTTKGGKSKEKQAVNSPGAEYELL